MQQVTFTVKYTKSVDKKRTDKVLDLVKNKFRSYNLDINFEREIIDLDESDSKNYSTDWSRSFLDLKWTKSIASDVLENLYTHGDGVILFVDKDDAVEQANLRGQATLRNNKGLIEIYSEPKKYVRRYKNNGQTYYGTRSGSKGADYKHDEYVLQHELIHVLAQKYTSGDLLHNLILSDLFELYTRSVAQQVINKLKKQEDENKDRLDREKRSKEIVHLDGFGLLPLVESKVQDVMREMSYMGQPMRVIQGFRSIEEQDQLYAQGRTKPGRIVTNAKGGQSFHNYGIALDCNFLVHGWNAPDWLWKEFGRIAKKHGFEWGGDWKSFQDRPHIHLSLGHSITDFQKGRVDMSKFEV